MATKIKLGSNGNWGVKDGGVLGFNDENGVFKAIELASSRASGATYVNESGLIADAEVGVPRIDWTNGVGELLLEPQSSNLYDYSEDLNLWGSVVGLSISADSTLSPDGSVNADLVTEDTSTGAHTLRKLTGPTTTAGLDYSFSFFVKSNGRDIVALSNDAGSASANAFLNITSGSVLSSTFDSISMEDYGNGWWRIKTTLEATGTGDYNTRIYTAIADGSFTHTGDGVSGLYIWGLQLEQQSYPTSYIRTEGSQVTRIADAVTGNSSLGQVINSSEGVLYFEGSCPNDSNYFFSLSDGSSSNQIFLGVTSSNLFYAQIRGASSTSADMVGGTFTSDTYFKIAVKYKENDFALWVNGVEVETDDSGVTPTGLVTLKSGYWNGTSPFQGKIKDLRVYDVALTDEELQNLTTL